MTEHNSAANRAARLTRLLTAAALTGLATAPAAFAQAPEAKVTQGQLQGVDAGDGIAKYLGIPFAAPPVGPLRWRDPQPPTAWNGVRDASKFGAACAQQPVPDLNNEDCLYLNVWAPQGASAKRLPVMVWIHGGGFTLGSGSLATFDGTALARKGVIVVTVNYRLGAFGFMAHPELTRESPHKTSGNYGLADQIAALQWVRDNIGSFGGDPQQVTIFGQSAGSVAVLSLMASPPAKGLFQRVIAQSGTPMLVGAGAPLAEAEQQGAAFAAAQGGASIAALRAMSADDIMRRWTAARGLARPIADGRILLKPPAQTFAAHEEARVPLMTGIAAREALDNGTAAQIPGRLKALYGDQADAAAKFYPVAAPADPVFGTVANTLSTDMTFRCPSIALQNLHAQTSAPVFAYQFEDTLPGQEAIRASHSSELPFVFGSMKYNMGGSEPPAETRAFADTLTTYWANFAKAGDPNGPGVPKWPRYTAANRAFMHLNSANLTADRDLRGEACGMFEKVALARLLAGGNVLDMRPPEVASASHGLSTATTTLGDLLDKPASRAVLERHIGELVANAQFQTARPQTLKSLQGYIASLTDAKLTAIDADLAKIQ